MVRKCFFLLCAIFFVFSLVWFSSCTKRVPKQDEQAGQSKKPSGLEEGDLGGDKDAGLQKRGVLGNIYFAFDDYSLTGQSKKTLADNAAWLAKNPQKTISIEGYCDERGTEEYNIALGERRANSAKKYLTTLGAAADRISTISYGEERPADPGHDEDAWAKNRRGEFVIE